MVKTDYTGVPGCYGTALISQASPLREEVEMATRVVRIVRTKPVIVRVTVTTTTRRP